MKLTHYLFASIFTMLAAGAMQSAARAADAAGACVHRPAPEGAKAKRVAIVVGNGAYAHGIPVLPNPTNDAEATSKALAPLGFETFSSTNADAAALRSCLDQAYASLADADVAMLYYSGHGIQINDENYLVATDAGVGDLEHGFVPVQPIVDALQKRAKATLVVLDACRNNPMAEEGHVGLSVSTGRGLSRARDNRAKEVRAGEAPAPAAANVQARGLMVAYSTSPNAVARDGTGHLSPFSEAFVKTVGTSGYSIQHVIGDVTRAVGEATQWEQTPWMKSSLTSELKLGGGETLEEARSISDNHAARSSSLLDTDNNKQGAIVEALKGLPASPDAATLQRFSKAYLALYSAVQGGEIVLPVTLGMNLVAVSTRDRAAVFRESADYQSGTFELWSISDRKVVGKPDIGGGSGSHTFTFSPHGTLLAVVQSNRTGVFDGIDGSKLFELRGRPSSVEFSPDESRLLLGSSPENGLTIVDVAARKPIMVVKATQLVPRTLRSSYLSHVVLGGKDKVCFVFSAGTGGNGVIGVFDLEQQKTTRLREVDWVANGVTCDPAGKYMIRATGMGVAGQGMEIWDLAADKVSLVKGSIQSITTTDPKGNYVSVFASVNAERGFYDLATGKRAYPPTVPDGYFVTGAGVRDPGGGIVSQDNSHNPWRDWPDESLYGPALVEKALAALTPAQRAEVERERITYTVVAGNP